LGRSSTVCTARLYRPCEPKWPYACNSVMRGIRAASLGPRHPSRTSVHGVIATPVARYAAWERFAVRATERQVDVSRRDGPGEIAVLKREAVVVAEPVAIGVLLDDLLARTAQPGGWAVLSTASFYRLFLPLGANGRSEATRWCGRSRRRLSLRPPSHADQEGASQIRSSGLVPCRSSLLGAELAVGGERDRCPSAR
jgi:hypothetical protein